MKKIVISTGAALGLLLSLPAWSDPPPNRDHRGGTTHYQDHGRRHDDHRHANRDYRRKYYNHHWYEYDRHRNNWYWSGRNGRRHYYYHGGRDHDHDRWYHKHRWY
jgi:hypothetical protein